VPLLTSKEVADDLNIPLPVFYTLAHRMSGMHPSGKYLKKGNRTDCLPSVYTFNQHQLLGRTLELAPGANTSEKIQSILDGYQLSLEEKNMLYQSPAASEKIATLTDRLNEIWETVKHAVASPRPVQRLTELPSEFDGLTPDEARALAHSSRLLNPESAYLLARRRDEQAALDYYLSQLDAEPGTKISGNEIIDVVCGYKPYLGKEFRRKGAAWRRFRSNLIGSGRLQEASKRGGSGYLVVSEAHEKA